MLKVEKLLNEGGTLDIAHKHKQVLFLKLPGPGVELGELLVDAAEGAVEVATETGEPVDEAGGGGGEEFGGGGGAAGVAAPVLPAPLDPVVDAI